MTASSLSHVKSSSICSYSLAFLKLISLEYTVRRLLGIPFGTYPVCQPPVSVIFSCFIGIDIDSWLKQVKICSETRSSA